MPDDINTLNDSWGLSAQERREHDFITQHLSLDEIEAVAWACDKANDVIQAQYYFACAKRDCTKEVLELLTEIIEDNVKIKTVKLGVPLFLYYS